jgi:hypothetical protein
VFGGVHTTQHRYHCSSTVEDFLRVIRDDPTNQQPRIYHAKDCPGIYNSTSFQNFPVINTLLSIPFSLLHNLPRLCGIFPSSNYQKQLIAMGSEIIALWLWDPSPSMIREMEATQKQNWASDLQNDNKVPKPPPIHHPSRKDTTFFNTHLHSLASSHNLNLGKYTIEYPLGPIFLGQPKEGGLQHVRGSFDGIVGSPVTSGGWSGTEDPGDTGNVKAVEDKSTICPSSLDIISWYQTVIYSELEPPPLIPTPFEKGIIGGMSVNDVLMVKGLIHPLVYIQFMDLTSFSLC